MLPTDIINKIKAYDPGMFTVLDELRWYFYLLGQGYTKKMARKYALYHLLPSITDRYRYELKR